MEYDFPFYLFIFFLQNWNLKISISFQQDADLKHWKTTTKLSARQTLIMLNTH